MKKLLLTLLLISATLLPVVAGGAQEEVVTNDAFGWVETEMINGLPGVNPLKVSGNIITCLLYTSDAADE